MRCCAPDLPALEPDPMPEPEETAAMATATLDPSDTRLCIGAVTRVGPRTAEAILCDVMPAAAATGSRRRRSNVGDFVAIELDDAAVLGRITASAAEPAAVPLEPAEQSILRSIVTIQLLSTIGLRERTVEGGLPRYPRLGARVFAAEPSLIAWIAEASAGREPEQSGLLIGLGTLPAAEDATVRIAPERLFGRHCAVIGATGGGKSWTLARTVEEVARFPGAKVILLDATGEFHTLSGLARHLQIGEGDPEPPTCKSCVFPYRKLTEGDLFALFRPSGPVQGPKLRQAIKSLKLARLEPSLASAGLLIRFQRLKAPVDQAFLKHSRALEGVFADFNIDLLVKQIQEECVHSAAGSANAPDYARWGLYNEADKSECTRLLGRIEDICTSAELACLFQPAGKPSVIDEIEEFLESAEHGVLRISLKYLSFSYNAREIMADAIGRHLLALARTRKFRGRPTLVVLDEAHQFLNKALGEGETRYPLEAFDLLAKEGRKYSLSLCLATQRPSDIPEGVLSQIGTLVVHRLTNERDRRVVEHASDEIDRSLTEFLPALAPGQAVLIGAAFPIPLTVRIAPPSAPPDSQGSGFQQHWSHAPTENPPAT